MATSGSIDYRPTARQIIDFALRKTNLLALGEPSDADLVNDALRELEFLLKEWQTYPGLWHNDEVYFTPQANVYAYSLTPYPYRVVDCRFRDDCAVDTPMGELTTQEYQDLPIKTSTGRPNVFWFRPQRDNAYLYIWPCLSAVTTETIRVTIQRRLDDVDDLDNHIDILQDHLSTVGYNLAAILADTHGRTGRHVDRIILRAEDLKQKMIDADRAEIIRMHPDYYYHG